LADRGSRSGLLQTRPPGRLCAIRSDCLDGEAASAEYFRYRAWRPAMSVRTPDWNGPGTGFIITDTVAYVDSIALFRRGRFPELGQLRRKYGKRIFVKPCGEPGQAPYGA